MRRFAAPIVGREHRKIKFAVFSTIKMINLARYFTEIAARPVQSGGERGLFKQPTRLFLERAHLIPNDLKFARDDNAERLIGPLDLVRHIHKLNSRSEAARRIGQIALGNEFAAGLLGRVLLFHKSTRFVGVLQMFAGLA